MSTAILRHSECLCEGSVSSGHLTDLPKACCEHLVYLIRAPAQGVFIIHLVALFPNLTPTSEELTWLADQIDHHPLISVWTHFFFILILTQSDFRVPSFNSCSQIPTSLPYRGPCRVHMEGLATSCLFLVLRGLRSELHVIPLPIDSVACIWKQSGYG